MVGDWRTDVIAVEYPVVGALKTGLLIPVPGGTSDIGDLLDWSEDTLSVVQVVANIAAEAVAIAVEGVALVGNGDTDFVGIENPVVGALKADLLVPVP